MGGVRKKSDREDYEAEEGGLNWVWYGFYLLLLRRNLMIDVGVGNIQQFPPTLWQKNKWYLILIKKKSNELNKLQHDDNIIIFKIITT